jgi:hypothetical protein
MPVDDPILELPLRFARVLDQNAHVFAVGVDGRQPRDGVHGPVMDHAAISTHQARVRRPVTPGHLEMLGLREHGVQDLAFAGLSITDDGHRLPVPRLNQREVTSVRRYRYVFHMGSGRKIFDGRRGCCMAAHDAEHPHSQRRYS